MTETWRATSTYAISRSAVHFFRLTSTIERTETVFLFTPSSDRISDLLGKTCARNQIAYRQL